MKRYISSSAKPIRVVGGISKYAITDKQTRDIEISYVLNKVPFTLIFHANHGRYVINGIDSNEIVFGRNMPMMLTLDGGDDHTYPVNVPESIMKSEPDTDQTDFDYIGQYYNIQPVIRYVRGLLNRLLNEHPEYFNPKVLAKFGIQSSQQPDMSGRFLD